MATGNEEDPFFLGCAISTFQNSGDPNSNWGAFERRRKYWIFKTIAGGERCGHSCGFWDSYEGDILLAKNLGSNSFRFSLEWSRVMPSPGQVDLAAVQRFHDIFDCIKKHGMEPLPTLYHFVHPQWFEELGGFTKQVNVKHFVDWCRLAFDEYGSKARYWATINEANIQSMCGFVMGLHPPGIVMDFKACGLNLLHLMQAHAAVYRLIKSMPGGHQAQVGIVHNIFWLEPKGEGPMYAHVRLLCKLGNFAQATPQVMEFLSTGRFRWQLELPLAGWLGCADQIDYQDPLGKPGLDFIGLNNYTRGVVDWKLTSTTKQPGEVMADFDWPIYPPALYSSIACVGQLGVPIIITENGIPDHLDDQRRPDWINGYLGEVVRAMRDGFDVRGFQYWTLMDNFEWNYAWTPKFGLYQWDKSKPHDRKLREGSKVLEQWYRRLPGLVAQVRQEREQQQQQQQALPTVSYAWHGALLVHGKQQQQEREEQRQEVVDEEEDSTSSDVLASRDEVAAKVAGELAGELEQVVRELERASAGVR